MPTVSKAILLLSHIRTPAHQAYVSLSRLIYFSQYNLSCFWHTVHKYFVYLILIGNTLLPINISHTIRRL